MHGGGAIFAAAVGGALFTALLTATLMATFSRENTGNFDRWGNKTAAERQGLMGAVAGLGIANNVSDREVDPISGGDHDGDGISDDDEAVLDTDPTNPDTDGDGTGDGTETGGGTDPKDPDDGGVPTVDEPTDTRPIKRLVFEEFYKVANQDGKPTHSVQTQVGSGVSFHIHLAVMNFGGRHTVIIEDQIASGFEYAGGLASVNGQQAESLTAEDLRGYRLEINNPGRYTVDLRFQLRVTSPGVLVNVATTYEVSDPLSGLSDKVFVIVTAPDGTVTLETPCTICNFSKLARIQGSNAPWTRSVVARHDSAIEFRIAGQFMASDLEAATIKMQDILPPGLSYLPGTLVAYANGERVQTAETALFNQGIDLLIERETQVEIVFSVKVDAEGRFDLDNDAVATVDQNQVFARATIISKP